MMNRVTDIAIYRAIRAKRYAALRDAHKPCQTAGNDPIWIDDPDGYPTYRELALQRYRLTQKAG